MFCATNAGVDDDPERAYVVVGCGPVGLMTTVAALSLGAQVRFDVFVRACVRACLWLSKVVNWWGC